MKQSYDKGDYMYKMLKMAPGIAITHEPVGRSPPNPVTSHTGDRDLHICCHSNRIHSQSPLPTSTCEQLCHSLNKRQTLPDLRPFFFSLFSPLSPSPPLWPCPYNTPLHWPGVGCPDTSCNSNKCGT